ncbi:MAG TPA: ABC transporter ATP-binding protein [Chitinophagaceae bacterium]|nr:ABC transporter ATP-binding protein [Chitinophagaceae bacterium]
MSSIIDVRELTKSFNEITAVDHLTFTVKEKGVYGFLGQNGAGKSTTIRMLLSLIRPTSGEIKIFGLDLSAHRKEILQRIGAIIEKPDLYKYLTAIENLNLFAKMSGLKLKRKQLLDKLEKVGLAERADSKIKTYSQGMKQRLGIAVALVHDPDLIILDEPMNGLDPQGIADIRQLIHHLSKDQGKTVFISSHLLSEMEQMADSLLIIHRGKKIAEGNMNELLNPDQSRIEFETGSANELELLLKQTYWANKIVSANGKKIIMQMKREEVPVFIRQMAEMKQDIFSIHKKNSLEDYFLSLTSH